MFAYDSWNENYKTPFGAIEQNQPIYFTIRLGHSYSGSNARLRVWPDGGQPLIVGMQRLGSEAGFDPHFCAYALAMPGLYWYDFVFDTPYGCRYLALREGGSGDVSEQAGAAWQLTVYSAGFHTPDWLKGGIIYQIMPDRFQKAGGIPEHLPAGRFLREDWGGTPEYRGDEDGKYFSNTYFGGNLSGITEKLPYLKSLGVTALYLNPIFEAHSNHRYNTADYLKIDPQLGTEEDFRSLCRQSADLQIRVVLDGVFSHTGDDSRYFNRLGRYEEEGAYQSQSSPYFSWYNFKRWPDDYRGWWGYQSLPEVNETDASYLSFITGPDGVLEHWLRAGASGFRLDVADELPSAFIKALRKTVKSCDSEAIVIGEVWEDASRKTSYGERRPYLGGAELDSVMNYPFRNAIIAFLSNARAQDFVNSVITILEHYPKPCIDVLMNVLGTHDTPRILTELAGDRGEGRDRAWKAEHSLSPAQKESGLRLLRLAAVLQFFLPGVPCIYYGDEACAEGYEDPFNRRCYRWGEEDPALLAFYRMIGSLRGACPALCAGSFRLIAAYDGLVSFERASEEGGLICAVNAGDGNASFALPAGYTPVFSGGAQQSTVILEGKSYAVFGSGSWPVRFLSRKENEKDARVGQ